MVTRHDLLVFGGAANTGLELVRHARSLGLRVACMVRSGRDINELAETGATVLSGDAFAYKDCQNAVRDANPSMVLSLLGGCDASGRRVDAIGNIHAIEAAAAWQENLRFLLFTSMGCAEQGDWLSAPARAALAVALAAKTEAERHLRCSTLRWTILRPAGLSHAPGRGEYALVHAPTELRGHALARSDAALAALDALLDPMIGQVLTVAGT